MHSQLTRPGTLIGLFFLLLLIFQQAAVASSPVWKIENAGHVSYLAGTVHILRASDYPLPKAFDQAYQQAAILAFEVDIDASRSPDFNQAMLQISLLPQGQTIRDHLSKDTYQQLTDYLKKNQLPIQQFSTLRPSILAITLTMLEMQKMGVGDQGVDEHFYTKAKREGKTVQALESIQQQIDFIAQMGIGVEDEMIRQTLADITTLQTEFNAMIKSWRNGDRAQLAELFVTPMREQFEPVYQQLLVQRNQNWMPKIHQYLKTPETELILVGSAHLLGPDGLLQQLEKSGYRITQLD